MAKKLLIISADFPPSATVGAKRPGKLAQACNDFGWEPHVLTMQIGCYSTTDVLPPALEGLHIARVACRSIWLHSENWRRVKPGPQRWAAMASRAAVRLTEAWTPIHKYYPCYAWHCWPGDGWRELSTRAPGRPA